MQSVHPVTGAPVYFNTPTAVKVALKDEDKP
jgi:hypothetical protein